MSVKSRLADLLQDLDCYEFPRVQIQEHGGIPQDTSYNYVSSSFLNGLVNYGAGHVGYLFKRYELTDKDGNSLITDSMSATEIEALYQRYADNAAANHHFSADGDDWLIFYGTDVSYMFMWYDLDCSDCSVERWSKQSCSAAGVHDLESFIQERVKLLLENWKEAPTILVRAAHPLGGWISG